jgi:hypothetical protein
MKKTVFRTIAAVGLATLAVTTLTACDTDRATSGDMCAYTVGNGQNGHNASVNEVHYPNDQFKQHDGENTMFFPCNSRNLRFEEGTTDTDAQGKPLGPLRVYTSTGTQVLVSARIDFTINEDKAIIKDAFLPWCSKYRCASDDPNVRSENFAVDGWTRGLLGENHVPVLATSITDTIKGMDDSVWKEVDKKDAAASAISASFMKGIRATMGSTADLFCGSGESSGWSGKKAGEGDYRCAPVRVTISGIQPTDSKLLELQAQQAKAELQKETNLKDLDAAKARYGSNAEQTLSDLDKIKACAETGKECNVYVGVNPTK